MNRTKPQLHRLLALDRLIRSGKYPNALTFARKWEVSQKTVQRDIEFLRDMLGGPLEYDRVRKGYYYSDPQWDLLGQAKHFKSHLDEESLNPSLFESSALDETTDIRKLIELGGDVNWQDPKDHWTPLMMAAHSGRADTVKLLLKQGARVGILNVSGDSALTYAVKSSDANIVRQLLKAASKQGLTPKQVALDSAKSELERKLKRLCEMRDELSNFANETE
jgi:Ankyrin repeats (3 copies)